MSDRTTYWQKLRIGEVRGVVMPLDPLISELRRDGLSLGEIARRIDKRKSYVQQRLQRIAAREEPADE